MKRLLLINGGRLMERKTIGMALEGSDRARLHRALFKPGVAA
jgi:hypothetical protein